MNQLLKKTLLRLGEGAGALAIAGALVHYYESSNKWILEPYYDPVGILTVCDGITGPQVLKGKVYTIDECISLREEHMKVAQDHVKRQISTYNQLSPWAQGALISFTYNVGAGNLASSTLKKKFNNGDFDGGCDELLKWVYANKQKLPGLVTRRGDENEVCKYWGKGGKHDPFAVLEGNTVSWTVPGDVQPTPVRQEPSGEAGESRDTQILSATEG